MFNTYFFHIVYIVIYKLSIKTLGLKKIQKTSNSAVFDVLNKYTNSELPDNNVNNNNNTVNSTIDLSSSSTIIDDYNISQDNKKMVFQKCIILIRIISINNNYELNMIELKYLCRIIVQQRKN